MQPIANHMLALKSLEEPNQPGYGVKTKIIQHILKNSHNIHTFSKNPYTFL